MKTDLDPKTVLNDVLAKMKAPALNRKLSHSEEAEQFAYVAARDALIELGVSLARAEDLATSQGGCARKRFWKCARILGFKVPGLKA